MLSTQPNNLGEITLLLARCRAGDTEAADSLFPLIYRELQRLAHSCLQHERPGHTLQTAALVNEAYLRLFAPADDALHEGAPVWRNRAHFFGIAARQMRRVLIDYARARQAAKREGERQRVELSELDGFTLPVG